MRATGTKSSTSTTVKVVMALSLTLAALARPCEAFGLIASRRPVSPVETRLYIHGRQTGRAMQGSSSGSRLSSGVTIGSRLRPAAADSFGQDMAYVGSKVSIWFITLAYICHVGVVWRRGGLQTVGLLASARSCVCEDRGMF
jgi:hypothetical protein